MRTLPVVKKSIVIINDILFFSPFGRSANSQHWIQYRRWHQPAKYMDSLLEIFCVPPFHLSPRQYRRKLQAHRCVFFSAAVMVIFRGILRSCIPQGRSFPCLAQSWSLRCCPFDLERKIPHLMYNFDFLVIKIAVWELITAPPIHPAEVQGYLWNISASRCVNFEEISMLLFT